MEKRKKRAASSGLPRLVRQVNLQTVTREMRRLALFSKIEMARQLGISTTTMTKLFAQLEADGMIEKSPVEDKSFGRPKILYQLSPALQVASIVVDVETTTIGFSGLQGDVLPGNRVVLPSGTDARDLFARIAAEFSALQRAQGATCRLVGVCIPGLIESRTGMSMLNPNMHWLEGACPGKELQTLLGIPAFVMHEEMALSRAQLRAADDTTDYIAMDFVSGVGMSVVSNGRHLSGASGFAGEIGHVIMQPGGALCGCGNHGCLETIASDRAFQAETGLPMDEALQRLGRGEPKTVAAAQRVLVAQATGIAAVVNIFNPERIFVHSRLAETYPGYIQQLREEVKKRAINLLFDGCTIEATRDGKTKGALLQTIDRLIEQATRHH